MPVVIYAYPRLPSRPRSDLAITPDIIGALAEAFGEYPFLEEKYGNCTVPFGGGMEHQTLTAYALSGAGGRPHWTEWLNVHELAHQWWGDWVTCADWRDLWLNEGFATYREWLWAEHKGDDVLQTTSPAPTALASSSGPCTTTRSPFSGTVYDKGAWVLRMLPHS